MKNFVRKRLKADVLNRVSNLQHSPQMFKKIRDAIDAFLNDEIDFVLGQNFILMKNSPKSNYKRFITHKPTLEQLFDEYHKWAEKQFPDSTYISSVEGLKREVIELEFEFHNSATTKTIAFEYVDIMMYCMDSARRYGISSRELFGYFRRKLEINKQRQWAINEDSSYSHIKKLKDGK